MSATQSESPGSGQFNAGRATLAVVLKDSASEVTVRVPEDIWQASQRSVQSFLNARSQASDASADEVDLLSRFVLFLTSNVGEHGSELLFHCFEQLLKDHVRGNDVHCMTEVDATVHATAIQATFAANNALEAAGRALLYAPKSNFIKAAQDGSISLGITFGGQGYVYINELQALYPTYKPLIHDYLVGLVDVLQADVKSPEAVASSFVQQQLNVVEWLKDPTKIPSENYLISAPVSMPLVGLTQLLQYAVSLRALNMSPGDMRKLTKIATGHSQGLISAVVASASDTWEDYVKNSQKAVRMLLWMGIRAQERMPTVTPSPQILQDSVQAGEGVPQRMLSITSLPVDAVRKVVDETNQYLSDDRKVHVSLLNGTHQVVASGPDSSLYGLNVRLRKMKGLASSEQGRVPYSKRKTPFTTQYLLSTVPFHSPYLKDVPATAIQDFKRMNLSFSSDELKVPVVSLADGSDLRSSSNLTDIMTHQILCESVDWPKVCSAMHVTHVVDFGPGGFSGCGKLIHHNLEGTGTQVIVASVDQIGNLLGRSVLYDTAAAVPIGVNWAREFMPRLLKSKSDGQVHIDTKLSRLLGRPPIIVPGMTPTTISGPLITATLNAGYQIEISGGGHFRPDLLDEKIRYIQDRCRDGEGVTLNMLFLNQALWGWQYPHVQTLRRAGIPIEGVTIAAGVPSPDKAHEFITAFQEAGIKHISFKPGTEATIRQVVAIAETHPDVPIIMQWTGGRAGGHHSFEDQHSPLLRTYGMCRRQKNLVLVAGGGLGDAKSTLRWLTGEWSEKFGRPPMPFDGVLMGSRLMVAKEALTSPAVKDLIVAAPGITEEEEATWETTYSKPHGGILTVTSELGEPIHKIANRGVRLWKEFDDTIFSLPREKQLATVLEKKDYIIQRLNADAQKVYFPAKLDGTPVSELTELTYEEVARRLVGLLFDIAGAWVDDTLRDLTGKWLRRVEERFTTKVTGTKLPDFSVLNTPGPFVDAFFAELPMARRQTLSKEDEDHFIELCGYPRMKPVPFIPRLDERFNTWFKKDSLWQSEALQFVVGHDADRVNILHGPLAASYSTKANEPVSEILGDIYKGQIAGLTALGVETTEVEYFGGPMPENVETNGFSVSKTAAEIAYKITADEVGDLPSADDWLEVISGDSVSWLKALIGCKTIVTGTKSNSRWIDNPLRRTLRPRLGQKVIVSMKDELPTELTVFHKADDAEAAVNIARDTTDRNMIRVRLYTFSQHHSSALPLELRYRYCPECGAMPIKEETEGAIQRTKDFYSKLWLGDATSKASLSESRVPWELTDLGKEEQSITITKDKIVEFCRTVGNRNAVYSSGQQKGKLQAPMDYAMVVGWKSVIRALFAKHIDGDVLALVHLGNSFRVLKDEFMLKEGAELRTTGEVTAVKNDEAGNKIVEVCGVISDASGPVIEIVSRFLYRGAGKSWDYTFSKETHVPVEIMLKDAAGAAVARSKSWVKWTQPDQVVEGAHLTFHTQSLRKYKSGGGYAELHVTGHIMAKLSTMEDVQIGTINFEGKNCAADPVESYLQRHGIPLKDVHMFEEPRYFEISEEVFDVTTKAPASNMPYSLISGDTNPIHTNPYFSDLAGLPATIVHGMWSSAAVRRLIETFAADNLPHRVTLYSVDFVGMVLPDDVLNTTLSHVGMTQGKKLINITVTNQQGSIVIKGTAEVEEAPTAYVFTGQGSQSPGMGMDLYGSSKVAKDLWDRADLHLKHMYGFSILDIVRRNPKEIVIYFGGKHGAVMRNNYRKLVYEVAQPDGSMKALPLFPEVSPTSSYHTFVSPKGLLNATQFTQPALTLMEVAAYKDMEEKGLVQKNAAFAGHSLGEYSSLSAIAEVLPIEALVDVVFYRGMTMQVAVPRDDKGRSDYGMVAVNPTRVTEGFGHEALEIIVDTIRDHAKQTLQIVNYNVIGQQYVASGELTTLDCLANVLNYIKLEKINVNQLLKTMSKENVLKQLQKIIASVYEKCLQKKKLNGGRAVSERGFATIPLPGIDVPFHSSFLLSGVAPFRELLKQKLSVEWIDVKALRRRYIPNLVARPFDITKEFVECVHKSSSSPLIEDVLKTWKDELNAGEQQQLGFLLLVELLAYQFASPVRWIETQDVIFGEFGIERLVEIGPEPTLTTMASRTLKAKYEKHDDASSFRRMIVHVIKQHDELYYKGDGGSAPAAKSAPAAPAAPAAAAPAPAPVAAAPVAAASGPATAVADAKITASEILRVMVSTRVRKPMAEVPLTKTIKELVGGKSTLQNEILGDLGQEFPGFTADKPEEEPLKTLAGSLTGSGSLGKVTSSMTNKMIGSKMPGGFGMSKVREHMSTVHGLGPLRTDGALLHGLTMEPASRLGSEADAKKWLDSVAQSYAAEHNVSLGAAAPAAGAPMMMAAPAAGAGPAAAVPDAPVAAIEFIRVLVAVKMKMPATSDLDKRSIKELVAGKSTLQNELLGDLQQEFGDAVTKIDGAADMPLADVAKALQPTYTAPGKYMSRAVQKLVSAKMPGSFGMTAVKAHLASKGLGPQRQDGALLHALSMEPAARLGGDGDAKAFWDGVTSAYASAAGVSLGGGGGGAMMASAGPAVSSAAMTAFQERYNTLLKEQMSLFATYLDEDPRAGWNAAEDKQKQIAELQGQLDAIKAELGDVFIDGLAPMFTRKKARVYAAAWNWAKQDYVKFLLDMTSGKIAPPTLSVAHQRMVWHIMNRADKTLFNLIEFYTKIAMARGGDYFERLRAAGYMLAKHSPAFAPVWMLDIVPASQILSAPPLYIPVELPTAPSTTITNDGVITYNETSRPGVASYADYAKEMAHGMDVSKLQQSKAKKAVDLAGELTESSKQPKDEAAAGKGGDLLPFLTLKGRSTEDPMKFEYNQELTQVYLEALHDVANNGITFKDKVALCTGCGKGSIGIEIVKMLLAGGCKVICTTSSYSRRTCDFYREVYEKWGAKGSRLNVVPFNGGSSRDIQAVVDFVYDDEKNEGLGTDLDFIVPFAAISEQGIEIDTIGSRSELAHRIMLTNVLRLLGAVASKKAASGQLSRPTQTILPMSPNHGLFGGDGLYSESKIGLEVLFNKWHSEHWGRYLTIVGASIGWTRGTGLMAANNLVAEGIEKLGVRTFSTPEMALNIVTLMHSNIVKLSERDPVWADLNGGLHLVENLNGISSSLRTTIREVADVRSSVAAEKRKENSVVGQEELPAVPTVNRRSNMQFKFPELKAYEKLHKEIGHMKGMVDPAKVVVVTGYGEVGPWGGSRTRWQMEADGQFSLEGCIELAWIMGLIKYQRDPKYSGWTNAKTGAPLKDVEVKKEFEEEILKHTGVRVIEPELFGGYDPKKKMLLHQVSIDKEMAPVECGEEEAKAFKLQHGDSVDIWEKGDGVWEAKLRKGAQLYIPKALKFTRTVAGQVPTGWSAERYGLSKDLVDQVDPITLYTLVSTVEALVTSGVTDPYEFYKYIHVSELGNTSGGGMGGMDSLQGIFRRRFVDQPVQKDVLQESFINVMPAWVNLLLLSSSGPIKTPVGACATAVESVEIGVETIVSGKAKVVIAGGYDDFGEEGSYEFANMQATSDASLEELKGRTPSEMSRPTTTSRAGFMESQGAGIHVLMSAETAFEMGVPIYGIVGLTNTATDKEGRSVPAPGQGILTTARERRGVVPQRLLDFNWRKRQVQAERANIAKWVQSEHEYLQDELSHDDSTQSKTSYIEQRVEEIKEGARRKEQAALDTYGQGFYRGNTAIAPLRGALAVWGLDVDDISVASFHGTSTQANDYNESSVVNAQVAHLGRSKGNLLPTVFQKWLTGHPKGAAAAWMLNGCLQMLEHQRVPGNRNADNVDDKLAKFSHLFFPSRTLEAVEIKSCLLKSFGFGQVGGECLVIHPDYILATLDEADYKAYAAKRAMRQRDCYNHYHQSLTGGKLVQVKDAPPYTPEQEQTVYLDPLARAAYDTKAKSFTFRSYTGQPLNYALDDAEQQLLTAAPAAGDDRMKGIGCDVELLNAIPLENQTFMERNFTAKETAAASASKNPRGTLAGKWSAKEAVIKAVSSFQDVGSDPVWDGASAPLREIEIADENKVVFHGRAAEAASKAGISSVAVKISLCGAYSMAFAKAS